MLVLPAELTHRQAQDCATMLCRSVKTQGDTVVVDAQALERFDSSALAVLLECRREALAQGKAYRVRHLSQKLRELAVLYGVVDLLPAAP